MSHPLLHSTISFPPVIAGFNSGLRDTNLPRVRLPVGVRLLGLEHEDRGDVLPEELRNALGVLAAQAHLAEHLAREGAEVVDTLLVDVSRERLPLHLAANDLLRCLDARLGVVDLVLERALEEVEENLLDARLGVVDLFLSGLWKRLRRIFSPTRIYGRSKKAERSGVTKPIITPNPDR